MPLLLSIVSGIFLRYVGAGHRENLRDREAFTVVAIGWLLIAFIGALPYLLSGTITNFVDAYFEYMSGFSTSGSTVLEVPAGLDYLNVYSHSILLWRALSQWIGGMGVILLAVVILARILGHRVAQGLLTHASGRNHDRLVIVQRYQVQQQIVHAGLAGAQERLGITGAVLEFEPDEGWAWRRQKGLGHATGIVGWQCQSGCHQPTELEELPAGHTVLL